MPFQFKQLDMPGLVMVESRAFPDSRGWFMELFQESAFCGTGIPTRFAQDNYSFSSRGVLRGLHFQREPNTQGKLVMPLYGKVYDVVVDLREGSPTYQQWRGFTLSSDTPRFLYVPGGFAHGFCVLSEQAGFLYKCTCEYSPRDDGGIYWNDSDLNIDWPVDSPVISDKDAILPRLRDAVTGFRFQP